MGISKSSFFFRGVERQDFEGLLWGPIDLELLFRLRGLGPWPNNPVQGREHIRGLSDKEEMKWYYGKRQSIFVVGLTVSEEDVHLGTFV